MTEPYYQDKHCKCGCGLMSSKGRIFISGHNLKNSQKTDEHRRKIGIAQQRAWDSGRRKRAKIGEAKTIDGRRYIHIRSEKGWLYWKLSPLQIALPLDYEKLTKGQRHCLRVKGFDIPKRDPGRMKGSKLSPIHKENIRKSHHRKYLFDLCAMDRDARARIRKTPEYRDWRKFVFVRENYTCQSCNARSGNGKTIYLEAHHIKSFAKHPKLRFEVGNGLTLCRTCHKSKTSKFMHGNKNGKRKAVAASRG